MGTAGNIIRFLRAVFGIPDDDGEEWDGYDREQNMED